MIFWRILTNQGCVESVQRHFVLCKLFSKYFFLLCNSARWYSCICFSLESKTFFSITNLAGVCSTEYFVFCFVWLSYSWIIMQQVFISQKKKKKCRNIKGKREFLSSQNWKKSWYENILTSHIFHASLYTPPIKTCHMSTYLIKSYYYDFFLTTYNKIK